MRITLVLPHDGLDVAAGERAVRLVRTRFARAELSVAAPPDMAAAHRALSGAPVSPYDASKFGECDVVILQRGQGGQTAAGLPTDLPARVYAMDVHGRMLPINRPMDPFEFAGSEAHVFNRLESREPEGGFYYFPYGYLFRYTGMGPINAFGFRITQDLDALAKRPPEHKVIAVFGGSGAWSMYAAPDETFHVLLERRLNDAAGSERFTVVNFGMHGHVVMNEMLAYLLFCHRLKPDFVIGHDGWNDFFYGMLSDEFLLNRYDLTYQYNLEMWSQLIHGSFDRPVGQPDFPLQPVALPQNVIKAYVRRKLQFQRIVEAFGGTFIWALQPSAFSKRGLSPAEKEVTELPPGGAFNLAYPRVRQLLDGFEDLVALPAATRMVNFHKAFAAFGEDTTLFGDHVHTLPAGDAKVAELYAEYFLRNLLADEAGSREASAAAARA